MNSITLQGTIASNPELRYTGQDQTPIATSLLEFLQVGQGGEDVPVQVKLLGWGTRNSEALMGAKVGQQVVLTGRIGINTIELEDGYKAKRAELSISHIVTVG